MKTSDRQMVVLTSAVIRMIDAASPRKAQVNSEALTSTEALQGRLKHFQGVEQRFAAPYILSMVGGASAGSSGHAAPTIFFKYDTKLGAFGHT